MNSATLARPVTTTELRLPPGRRLSALAEVFGLTVRQNVRGRRLWVLAFLATLPCGLAVLLRSLSRPAPPDVLETALVFNLIPHALAPLTALLYAAGMIRDEVEGQTLTYLLLRPVPKGSLYVAKWLATLLTTAVLIGLFTVALYVSIYWGTPELWGEILPGRAFKTVAVLALAQFGYCSLFGCLGLLTRRSLIAGVVYIVALEGVLANLNFLGRALTVVYYFRILVLRWLDLPELQLRQWERVWQLDLAKVPDSTTCVATLLLAGLAVTLLSALWFRTSEYPVKTPEGGD